MYDNMIRNDNGDQYRWDKKIAKTPLDQCGFAHSLWSQSGYEFAKKVSLHAIDKAHPQHCTNAHTQTRAQVTAAICCLEHCAPNGSAHTPTPSLLSTVI